MPKCLIEREIPGAGSFRPPNFRRFLESRAGVLSKMGPKIHWLESFVTDDKIYCVAPDEATVREHATQGGFPANRVSRISRMIDPTTPES